MTPDQEIEIADSIARFKSWLETTGYESFDPYDLWGTRYGLWARKHFYRRGKLAAPLIAPIVLADLAFPSVRSLLVKKCRYATADAQLVLAYMNLFESGGDRSNLERAVNLAEDILGYSIPGYSGLCWGYPFDWQNNKAMWPRNTPYITCTPYCYEAFVTLASHDGLGHFLDKARSVADFIYHDLHETEYAPGATAGSYSPLDSSMVINASAYRAWALIDAGKRFSDERFTAAGLRNLNFVIQSQSEDGSWLYGLDTPADRFIDHFHTCFVLKNLKKISAISPDSDVSRSIRSGWKWYQEHLFYPDGQPKAFAKKPRFQTTKLEMYNHAEAITLGVLLSEELDDALPMAERLALDLVRNHQLPKGYFATRTYPFGFRHSFPFIRWPQAQLFLALTNLHALLSTKKEKLVSSPSK